MSHQAISTIPTPTPPASTSTQRRKPFLQSLPILQIAVLLAVIVWAVVRMPEILTPVGVTSVLVLASLLGMAAVGQTLVVLLGGLDLAVPGYIVVGAFAATTLTTGRGWPLWLALLFAAAVAGGAGAFVGYVSQRFNVPSLVITLGMSSVLSGAIIFATAGNYTDAPPEGLRNLTGVNSTTFGLPVPPVVVFWIVLIGLMLVFLTRTTTGRRLYATGSNPQAAQLSRVNARRMWVGVFAANGVLSAAAGVFIAAFVSGSSATLGEPYLFEGLAAVIVGGTTFGSVRGSYSRTAIGALLLTVLSIILVGEGLAEGESLVLYGLIILIALAIYGRDRRLRDRF